MTDFTILADKALRDEILTHEESLAVLQTPDSRLLELLQAAFTVRERYFGKTVRLQMLLNAKSGACQEDCGYCSQSAISKAPIERYGLLTQDQMVTGARRAALQSPAILYRHQRTQPDRSGHCRYRLRRSLHQAGSSDSDLLLAGAPQ